MTLSMHSGREFNVIGDYACVFEGFSAASILMLDAEKPVHLNGSESFGEGLEVRSWLARLVCCWVWGKGQSKRNVHEHAHETRRRRQLTTGPQNGRYIKGKRLHDPHDISCIKLDSVLQSVLNVETFNMSQFSSILSRALKEAPPAPVHITHRLNLSSTELKPTVVDVTVSVASERAVPIHDYSETFDSIDGKLKDMMQEVRKLRPCTWSIMLKFCLIILRLAYAMC